MHHRIDTIFEARAAGQPESVALIDESGQLTYRELDERADLLSAGLTALGVAPGVRVGICLERSARLVAAMLAVLKADAVYVPMDRACPAERLAYTVQDASLPLVVSDLPTFPDVRGTRLVTPDDLAEAGSAALAAPGTPSPPTARRGAEAPAYIIYTSGSTGRPKGVVVPHRNVAALLAATATAFELSSDDCWTLFHSSAFDFSVWEIWGALLTGGRLVVVPYWVTRSPEDFHDLLHRRRISVLNQTPSAFTQLAEAGRSRDPLPALRLVVFGGEVLDPRPLLPWIDRYPHCRMVNMFGITETTVHVTAQDVTRAEAAAGSRSVGRPIPGWHVHILNEDGHEAPPGEPGEICVGGAGLALGYLGRPALTAERFVPDPFHGGRMYRSGDRGRLLPDGRIEHLGRLDNQVKVRGFRIELDEIRIVLAQHPSVAAAAVVVGGGPAARARLDAYVVLAGDRPDPDWSRQMREHAAAALPDYMVPATFTVVERFSLTPNGKLDPSQFPDPVITDAADRTSATCRAGDSPSSGRSTHTAGTAGGLADALAELWSKVLGVPASADDNFFTLGGNSLLAVEIRTAARERGLPVFSVRELYQSQTPRKLADWLLREAGHA